MVEGASNVNSNSVDPFASLPLLYFLPRSVITLEGAASAENLDDLESLHEFLKSRVSNVSKQLPVQVPEIVDSIKELPKDVSPHDVLVEKDLTNLEEKLFRKHTMAEGKENELQNRRPGLGRKRARFSLKLATSENVPVMNGQPLLDQLEDPEEFFAAYGRQENAEKELRRLQGSSFVDHTSDRCVSRSRMRRQGILGKTAKYKHSYAAICDNAFKHISSVKEASAQTISVSSAGNNYGPSNSTSSLVEGNNANREMVNDVGITEDKETDAGRFINPLMKDSNDGLLGSFLDACYDLGEGQTFNLVQKSLKLEQIDMHKIQLPKFNRFSLSSQTSLLKTDNSVESNMLTALQQTWASTINDRTPMRSQSDLDTRSPMTSPTPPKSPFASISSFCRNKSLTTTKRDPFMWSSMVSVPGRVSFFASPCELDMPSSHGGTVQQDTSRVPPVANTVSMDPDNNVSVITDTFCSELLEEGILGSKLHSPKTKTNELRGFAGMCGSTPSSNAPSKASGGIRQQDTTEFVGDGGSAHENGLVLLDGFPSRGLEEGISRTGSHSFSMQGDCTTSSADQSQEKNVISEISNGQPTRDSQSQVLVDDNVVKDSSDHQATDQRADEYSDPRNSVRAQSATGDTQFHTLDECNARNDNHCPEMPTDGSSFSASGVSGKVSNGSVKDVDRQSGAIKGRVQDKVSKTIAVDDNVVKDSSDHQATDQRADEYSDPQNSVRAQSGTGDTQFHTLDECNARNDNHCLEMPTDGSSFSASRVSGKVSNGSVKDVDTQSGAIKGRVQDKVSKTIAVDDNVVKDSLDRQATDQRADEYSDPRNSVRLQSATGDTQFHTLDECSARNDNHCLEVPTDGSSFSASGVSGKVSNGSVKDVDSQSGAIKGRVQDNVSKTIAVDDNVVKDSLDHQATDQRADEYSDPRNSVRLQSATGDTQFHSLDECNSRNDNHCLEMPTDGSSFSASGVSGKVSNGSVKDVDSQSGANKSRVQDNVQATVNPAAGMQEVLVGDSGDAITNVLRSGSQQISGVENAVVERNPQMASKAPSKALVRKRSMKEASGGRKSLIGAGTEWNSGLRRSTRIRSRPLEYWRGERFVYGRIHNSLVTVIGVKCASPAPNDKDRPVLKVKSFVPDEYSHLVDLAGSH